VRQFDGQIAQLEPDGVAIPDNAGWSGAGWEAQVQPGRFQLGLRAGNGIPSLAGSLLYAVAQRSSLE